MRRKSDSDKETIAYEGIISLIMSGRIMPGSRIAEQEIADELHTSRTPVRNAMRTLSSEGLIEPATGGGYSLFSLSRKDVKDLFRLRLVVEPEIVYDATRLAKSGDKQKFLDMLSEERKCYFEGRENLYIINRSFHLGIAAITGNAHMYSLQKRLFWRSEIYVLFFDIYYHSIPGQQLLRNPDESLSHKMHAELVNAIFDNDQIRARNAASHHIEDTWLMLRQNINALQDSYGKVLISDYDFELPEKLDD